MYFLRYLVAAFLPGVILIISSCASTNADNMAKGDAIPDKTYAKPGFHTQIEDGRLWVFREGSEELGEFEIKGEIAKHVIRPGAGPDGMTIKAPDAETLDVYLASKPGFYLEIEDGRLWVFKEGAKELEDFRLKGELAKHVIRPGAGPGGLTLKAPDAETLDDYLAAR